MPYCNEIEIRKNDIQNCLHKVNTMTNVLESACSCYFLERRKQQIVDKILDKICKLPREITRIKIPLLPVPANKPYYSFIGLETIVYNLFKTRNPKQIKSLENQIGYLKLYYEKNTLFNMPIILIEIIFFSRLHSKTIDQLWKTLKSEVLFFTGSVGDIEVLEVDGREHLSELLKIPLLFGYPEFKLNGVLLENNFSLDQIREMNYLHSFSLLPLKMKDVINNNTIELFEEQRQFILQERIESGDLINNLEEDEINDIVYELFANNPTRDNRSFGDELPF